MIKHILVALLIFCSSHAYSQFAGNSLDFDGTNDMVVVNSTPALFGNLGTNDFTFESWVNPRGSLFARIFYAQPSTTNFVSVGTATGNVIYFYVIVNGTTYSVATSAGIAQNQWTHVAARWTASTLTPQVFFNGVLQASVAGGTSSTGTSGLMVLGSRPGGAQYFNGALDESRLWNEARTECEIINNMNRNITGVQPNLVVNYDYNQGIAGGNNTGVTTLPDLSGNAYNGTLTNFTLTAATSNWITSGATVTSSGNPNNGVAVAQNIAVCSGASYTFPDGSTQTNITAPFAQVSTITTGPCDTIITTTVSVNPVTSENDTASICSGNNFTFPDGSTQSNITTPVSHTSNLQNISGCDSVIVTLVNVLQPSSFAETSSVCVGGSYTFPDSTTQTGITAQIVHVSTLTNTLGCDSVVTTTVNVNQVYAISETDSVCSGSNYTFPDSTVQTNLTSQVVHISNLASISGCDSIITTTVNVIQPDTNVVMINESLTAQAAGAVYQWLDCGNGYAVMPGDTAQSFTATANGSYALAITQNGCTDTSSCFVILSTSLNQADFSSRIQMYPNPAIENVIFYCGGAMQGTIEISDVTGATVLTRNISNTWETIDLDGLSSGVYMVAIRTEQGVANRKLIKK